MWLSCPIGTAPFGALGMFCAGNIIGGVLGIIGVPGRGGGVGDRILVVEDSKADAETDLIRLALLLYTARCVTGGD